METTLELGVVVKAHGIRGAVKVRLHNPASTALEDRQQLVLAQAGAERELRYQLLGAGPGGLVVLELEGVSSREAAEALCGARILVERAELPPLEEGEYYYEDLVGCRVEDEQGGSLGVVVEVFSAGASDVLVIGDGPEQRMIPLVDDWVTEVNLAERRIRARGAEQFEPSKR